MSSYEIYSLIFTGIYNTLTFLLLCFVVYESIIRPNKESVLVYFVHRMKDTKSWGWEAQIIDFAIENKGVALKNVIIKSNPDNLCWGIFKKEEYEPKKTSEYFRNTIPIIDKDTKHQFYWCDAEANQEVLSNQFSIIIEYDNPLPFYIRKRKSKEVQFNFSVFNGTYRGMNEQYNIHNVAQELSRIREFVEKKLK